MLDVNECLQFVEAGKDAEEVMNLTDGPVLEAVRVFQHHLVIAMSRRGLILQEDAAAAAAIGSLGPRREPPPDVKN